MMHMPGYRDMLSDYHVLPGRWPLCKPSPSQLPLAVKYATEVHEKYKDSALSKRLSFATVFLVSNCS